MLVHDADKRPHLGEPAHKHFNSIFTTIEKGYTRAMHFKTYEEKLYLPTRSIIHEFKLTHSHLFACFLSGVCVCVRLLFIFYYMFFFFLLQKSMGKLHEHNSHNGFVLFFSYIL